MDKSQALHAFWSQFGLPAYDENTVPDDAKMPYITYAVMEGDYDVSLPTGGSLWYRSMSWEAITKKAHEIQKAIEEAYPSAMKIDDGRVYFYMEQPFIQRLEEPDDDTVRRIYLNLGVQFLTAY